jgi:hypothetical protein
MGQHAAAVVLIKLIISWKSANILGEVVMLVQREMTEAMN